METSPIYTVYDISSESGVPVRTIYSWTAKRLVPKAVGRDATGLNYTESHLRRVLMVKEWLDSRITLEEMADRIDILGEKALEVPDPYADFDGWE